MQIRQNQQFIQSKANHDQLLRELRTGRQKSRESLGVLKSELRLEMSVEKGRQRDANLMHMLKFQDLTSKIDAASSNGYAALGKLRHDIFYSMTGFFFTSAAALLGYLRLCT